MTFYKPLRAVLFSLDPERAHNLTLWLLSLARQLPPMRAWLRREFSPKEAISPVQAFGLDFPNPVGLAAGYDKDGRAIHGLACLGFGHLELGTVTPHPQFGNPRPRIFRLTEDQALINRMGFPNAGAGPLLRRLIQDRPSGVVLGVNIGKGERTPLEEAAKDYLTLLKVFYPHADYLAVNVSSPNTIGLRRLQARHYLERLLKDLSEARAQLQGEDGRYVPILVKIAPDLNEDELEDTVGAIMDASMEGVIATNTTVDRPRLLSRHRGEAGGLSGVPLRERSTAMVRLIHRLTGGRLPILGVGGISGPEDAREKLDAGATLIQIYTGLVYRGPGLVREILDGLREN